MLKGVAASEGYGLGRVVKIEETDLSYNNVNVTDKQAEMQRFQAAIDEFCIKTTAMAGRVRESATDKEAEILMGHVLMLQDPAMSDGVKEQIDNGNCAEKAFENVCEMFMQIFAMTNDELTSQRIADIKDIKTRVFKIMLGKEECDLASIPDNTILVAKELTPSMTVGLNKDKVTGIITETGGKTSHSAILARALEIPAVLSVEGIMGYVNNGDELAVDGIKGLVYTNMSDGERKDFVDMRKKFLENKEALKSLMGKPTSTADGKMVEIVCNIGKTEDVANVLEHDGEGIGLFRTEFLFMSRDSIPSEEEQFEAYKQVAVKMDGKPVIIRTLDVGGDKEIPYLNLEKEENPFLGYRAIRVCLQRTEMYRIQLRALLRASAFGNIQIMIPMITCLDELLQVKSMIEDLKKELAAEGISYNENIKVGIMVETPAACLMADEFAKEADFFSIGTNDLTQYTMVADRGNASVAYLYSTYNPAVLRAIKNIIASGNRENIVVGMCGEAASDSLLIPLLLGYGLKEFSVSASAVLSTRNTISKWTMAEAQELVKEVDGLRTEKEVKELLCKRKR